jgi:hypothetical protein
MEEEEEEVPGDVEGPMIPDFMSRTARNPTPHWTPVTPGTKCPLGGVIRDTKPDVPSPPKMYHGQMWKNNLAKKLDL